MSARPPLALLIAAPDSQRLRAGLMLALCEAALGGTPRLFAQGEAAGLLAGPIAAPEDDAARAAGEPALAELLSEVLDAGLVVIACQSGLAIAGISAEKLDPRIEVGGLIGFLAGVGPDDRLLAL